MKKLDIDRDSRITLSDFTQAVLKDNLLLEALGQCLPSDDVCYNFFNNIDSKN